MRKTVFSLDRETEVDTLLSPRPPTGQQLNPLIVNKMNVRFKNNGRPIQRSILGQDTMFSERQQKLLNDTLEAEKANKKTLSKKRTN